MISTKNISAFKINAIHNAFLNLGLIVFAGEHAVLQPHPAMTFL